MKRMVGIVDTTFARVNMAKVAMDEIRRNIVDVEFKRYTVPGVKDLPVAVKRILNDGSEVAMAFGMPGATSIDKQCAHEASLGLIWAQLLTDKHVLEVFVHEDEAEDEKELYALAVERATKHALNLVILLENPEALMRSAGMGKRQGAPDAGPIRV